MTLRFKATPQCIAHFHDTCARTFPRISTRVIGPRISDMACRGCSYFGLQVKKGKPDSADRTKDANENVTEALNPIRMALQNAISSPRSTAKS